MHLTPLELEYWHRYVATLEDPTAVADAVVRAGRAGGPHLADDLLERYLDGRKTAGSGVLEDYLATDDAPPQVGDFWICLDGRGDPRCLLRTERIAIARFDDVGIDVAEAEAEGEGDLSVADWRRRHLEHYAPHLAAWGLVETSEATVVTEFFRVVHR